MPDRLMYNTPEAETQDSAFYNIPISYDYRYTPTEPSVQPEPEREPNREVVNNQPSNTPVQSQAAPNLNENTSSEPPLDGDIFDIGAWQREREEEARRSLEFNNNILQSAANSDFARSFASSNPDNSINDFHRSVSSRIAFMQDHLDGFQGYLDYDFGVDSDEKSKVLVQKFLNDMGKMTYDQAVAQGISENDPRIASQSEIQEASRALSEFVLNNQGFISRALQKAEDISSNVGKLVKSTVTSGSRNRTKSDKSGLQGSNAIVNLGNGEAYIASDFNTSKQGNIYANDFIQFDAPTTRWAAQWREADDNTPIGDSGVLVKGNISQWLGVEDGKIKIGSLDIFKDDTPVMPNKLDGSSIGKINTLGKLSEVPNFAKTLDRLSGTLESEWAESIKDEFPRVGFKIKNEKLINNPPKNSEEFLRNIDEYIEFKGVTDSNKSDVIDKVKTLLNETGVINGGISESNPDGSIQTVNLSEKIKRKIILGDEEGNSYFIENGSDLTKDIREILNKHPEGLYMVHMDDGSYENYLQKNQTNKETFTEGRNLEEYSKFAAVTPFRGKNLVIGFNPNKIEEGNPDETYKNIGISDRKPLEYNPNKPTEDALIAQEQLENFNEKEEAKRIDKNIPLYKLYEEVTGNKWSDKATLRRLYPEADGTLEGNYKLKRKLMNQMVQEEKAELENKAAEIEHDDTGGKGFLDISELQKELEESMGTRANVDFRVNEDATSRSAIFDYSTPTTTPIAKMNNGANNWYKTTVIGSRKERDIASRFSTELAPTGNIKGYASMSDAKHNYNFRANPRNPQCASLVQCEMLSNGFNIVNGNAWQMTGNAHAGGQICFSLWEKNNIIPGADQFNLEKGDKKSWCKWNGSTGLANYKKVAEIAKTKEYQDFLRGNVQAGTVVNLVYRNSTALNNEKHKNQALKSSYFVPTSHIGIMVSVNGNLFLKHEVHGEAQLVPFEDLLNGKAIGGGRLPMYITGFFNSSGEQYYDNLAAVDPNIEYNEEWTNRKNLSSQGIVRGEITVAKNRDKIMSTFKASENQMKLAEKLLPYIARKESDGGNTQYDYSNYADRGLLETIKYSEFATALNDGAGESIGMMQTQLNKNADDLTYFSDDNLDAMGVKYKYDNIGNKKRLTNEEYNNLSEEEKREYRKDRYVEWNQKNESPEKSTIFGMGHLIKCIQAIEPYINKLPENYRSENFILAVTMLSYNQGPEKIIETIKNCIDSGNMAPLKDISIDSKYGSMSLWGEKYLYNEDIDNEDVLHH